MKDVFWRAIHVVFAAASFAIPSDSMRSLLSDFSNIHCHNNLVQQALLTTCSAPVRTLLPRFIPSSSVPHAGDLGVAHLALELEDAVHQGLAGRGAAGNVDVHGDNAVAATDNTVRVVVVTAAVGTASHGDDPSGVGHLIVDLAQGGCHLVCEGAGNDHDIGLTRGGTENDSETILIVSWGGKMHHFDGTAGETKGHGPQGGLAGPVGDDIEGGEGILNDTFGALLASQWHLLADLGQAGGARMGRHSAGITSGTGRESSGSSEGEDGGRGFDSQGH